MVKGVAISRRVPQKEGRVSQGIDSFASRGIHLDHSSVCCIFSNPHIADQVAVGEGGEATID